MTFLHGLLFSLLNHVSKHALAPLVRFIGEYNFSCPRLRAGRNNQPGFFLTVFVLERWATNVFVELENGHVSPRSERLLVERQTFWYVL